MIERTLNDILESAKDGVKPSFDECYWAMLALDALLFFDRDALCQLIDESPKVERAADESLKRLRRAMATNPQAYMGPSNDPSHPAVQKRRQAAQRVFDQVFSSTKEN